jgi:hypothetical protein
MTPERFQAMVSQNNLRNNAGDYSTPEHIEGQLKVLMNIFQCDREAARPAVVANGRCVLTDEGRAVRGGRAG